MPFIQVSEKEKNSTTPGTKSGVITLANKVANKKPSKVVVSDDNKETIEITINDYFTYYEFYFSFILDSTYYYRMHKKIKESKIIPHFYDYNGKKYLGQYFDKWLIINQIAK